MNKYRKLIIGGVIILIAIAALGYASFMGGSTYYYEVGEFLDKGQAVAGQVTRVGGEVQPGAAEVDFSLHFTIKDMTGRADTLPVVYTGQVPSAFQAGRQAIVEGKLDADGVFQASNIITKCSSKD